MSCRLAGISEFQLLLMAPLAVAFLRAQSAASINFPCGTLGATNHGFRKRTFTRTDGLSTTLSKWRRRRNAPQANSRLPGCTIRDQTSYRCLAPLDDGTSRTTFARLP